MSLDGCGAPQQGVDLAVGPDEVVLTGRVSAGGQPVGGAFVRLLDAAGEFTAEVVSSPEGDFRFYAAPGTWTVRALHRSGNGQASVSADGPGVHPVEVAVA
ncbi:DUF1416 domain-containing protein [Saccharothrix coeruleofusca]|uniref:DUF1416 domain-containing protein n=1 Tax=Saccharothrix coeruleofusca TaxID=33919 RepID=A0A918ATE1_9PSEU|nr:DUF1416 domain-containing protein [Saccharothrix coeruleofusca]MBP2339638.1 hypothetical protein [Saccharothrix coeruleofusca]GGP81133.1 hypothetical protein GCM10010185_63950 [Saccharothrix coeruleofusca]